MPVILAIVAVLLWIAYQNQGGGVAETGGSPDASSYNPLQELVQAWAHAEGNDKPGSLAQRDNNPVNIHGNWPGVIGHEPSGEAIFDTPANGWSAAQTWTMQQAAQHPTWSFSNFFAKVLGDLKGNPVNNTQGNSAVEAATVTGQLGISPADQVASYLGLS